MIGPADGITRALEAKAADLLRLTNEIGQVVDELDAILGELGERPSLILDAAIESHTTASTTWLKDSVHQTIAAHQTELRKAIPA